MSPQDFIEQFASAVDDVGATDRIACLRHISKGRPFSIAVKKARSSWLASKGPRFEARYVADGRRYSEWITFPHDAPDLATDLIEVPVTIERRVYADARHLPSEYVAPHAEYPDLMYPTLKLQRWATSVLMSEGKA